MPKTKFTLLRREKDSKGWFWRWGKTGSKHHFEGNPTKRMPVYVSSLPTLPKDEEKDILKRMSSSERKAYSATIKGKKIERIPTHISYGSP